jgi:hypothetical protein
LLFTHKRTALPEFPEAEVIFHTLPAGTVQQLVQEEAEDSSSKAWLNCRLPWACAKPNPIQTAMRAKRLFMGLH